MKRIAIFAHYDKCNIIDDYVVLYLQKLKEVVDDVIFVSDSNLQESELSKIKSLILDSICERHGESNDFGSYKRGFFLLKEKYPQKFNEIDELVFANDSCYCLGSLEESFKKMDNTIYDAWAMNDHYHKDACWMQSNFMILRSNIFQKDFIQEFFQSVSKCEIKQQIVFKYEIGLSKLLIKNDKKIGVYFGYKAIENYISRNIDKIESELDLLINPEYGVSAKNLLKKRILRKDIGANYVYSDHFYSLINLNCPLVKCLAFVSSSESGKDNALVKFWSEIITDAYGKAIYDLIINHILRIGKVPLKNREIFTWDDAFKDKASDNIVVIKNRIAIFAHYDKYAKIDDYVITYLKVLKKNVDKIIFVSDGKISESELTKLEGLIFDYVCESHKEYDFGSHKRGFALLQKKYPNELENSDELVLANDSCYCVGEFSHVFRMMEKSNYDAWSLGDDYENNYTKRHYLQSYFLVIRKSVFLEKFFSNFLNSVEKIEDKGQIIFRYEMGFTQLLIDNKKSFGAYFSAKKINRYICDNYLEDFSDIVEIFAEYGIKNDKEVSKFTSNIFDISKLNYAHSDKYYILLKVGFPLLKRAIIVRDIKTFDDQYLTFFWKDILHKHTYFDCNIILAHLSRICRFPKSLCIIKEKKMIIKILAKAVLKKKNFFYLKRTKNKNIIIKILKIPVFTTKYFYKF